MDIENLVREQCRFFRSGATLSEEFRRNQLEKLHEAIVQHESVLLSALHADLRKSPHEAYASEIGFVLSEICHALRNLRKWMGPQRRRAPLMSWPARAFVQAAPYGVVLIIGPWNYPVQLVLAPLVGAMAGGNCAVLKPSELAPQASRALANIVQATFPSEYIAVVEGGTNTATALLHGGVQKIFFTGSTKVGRSVMAAAAENLVPVTLELGGKSPCIVCADAPIEITARRIAWGKFINAGQTCTAPDFVLVDRRVKEPLLAALVETIERFYGPQPHQSLDYGRIIHRGHFDRLVRLLESGKIVCGGQHNAEDLYIAPTVLTEVPPSAPAMQEEIFGPILPVLEFDGLDDALAELRDRPEPLALYLFTRDRRTEETVLARTRSGGVCLNDTLLHMMGKDLPFGGVGSSGMGAYHGRASFECFTHERSVLRRQFSFDSQLRNPPQRGSLQMLRRAMRILLRS